MSEITLVKSTNDVDPAVPAVQMGPISELTSTGIVTGDVYAPLVVPKTTAPQSGLSEFLQRATFLGNIPISSADVALSVIGPSYPIGQYLASADVVKKTANYQYIRGTFQVVVTITPQPGTYGRYVVGALPLTYINATVAQVNEKLLAENCMQIDHYGVVDLVNSNQVVLQLPFLWPRSWADLSSADGLGYSWGMYVTCLAPLSSAMIGAAAPTANLKVYGNFMPDVELSGITYQGKHKLLANQAMQQHAPKLHAMIGEGKGSAMAGTVADLASKLTSLPVIGPAAGVVSGLARGAESVLSFFGFSREVASQNRTLVVARNTGTFSLIEGEDISAVASLMPGNSISADPSLNGMPDEDPCALSSIADRWTLCSTALWTTAVAEGAYLAAIPVTPMLARGATYDVLQMTGAGYVALNFEFWRATSIYKIVVPCSAFHRGTLQVFWVPFDATVPADPTNVVNNVIFPIEPGVDLEVTVGMCRDRDFLSATVITSGTTIIPYGSSVNGKLAIRVLSPLTCPLTTASVQVSVFVKHQDFQVGCPRSNFNTVDETASLYNYPIGTSVYYQGGSAVGGDTQSEPMKSVLVEPAPVVGAADLYFGEDIGSVRGLMQKPCQYSAIVAVTSTLTLPILGQVPTSTNTNYATWAVYYRMLFHGLAASERWKLSNNQSTWVAFSRRHLTIAAVDTFSSTANWIMTTGQAMAEGQVPYYHSEKYILSGGLYSSTVGPLTFLEKRATTNTASASFNQSLYFSLAPDIRVTCFKQVPTIRLRKVVPATTNLTI